MNPLGLALWQGLGTPGPLRSHLETRRRDLENDVDMQYRIVVQVD